MAVAGCRSQAARLAMLAALNISPRLVKPRALTNHNYSVQSTNHSSPGLLLHLLHAAALTGLGQRHEAALRTLLQPGLGVVVVRHELRVLRLLRVPLESAATT